MLMRWLQVLMLGGLLSLLTIGTQAEQALPQPLIIGRGSIEWADWHPDGETIMVSTVNGAWLYTKDLRDLAHIPEARLARFSPDGRYIAGVDDTHTLRLWDAKTFEPVKSLERSEMHIVRQLTWSPDSRYLAVVGTTTVDEVMIWEVETETGFMPLYFTPTDTLAWSPGSTYLAGLKSDTGKVWVWDLEKRNIAFSDTPVYPPEYGSVLAWRSDHELTRGSRIDTLMFADTWDIALNSKIDSQDLSSSWQLAYNPDGTHLALAGSIGARVVNTLNHEDIFAQNADVSSQSSSTVVWSPNARHIAVGSYFALSSDLAAVWIADPFTSEITHIFKDHHRCVNMIRWQPQADYLLSVGCHDELIVRSLTEPELVSKSLEHTLITTTLAWKDDGSQLAIADALSNVYIHDTHSGALLMTLPHPYMVRKLAWQPGGDLLTTQSDDVFLNTRTSGAIKIWSTTEGTPLAEFAQDDRMYLDMDWSPDGKLLAVVGGGVKQLHIWDIEHPDQSYQLPFEREPSIPFYAVEWSPDGQSLAVPFSGSGGGVFLFAVPSGALSENYAPAALDHVWTAENNFMWLRWSNYGGAYSPPDLELTVGFNDFANVQYTLTGMSAYTVQGDLSPQGNFAAAVGENNSGLVWDMATGEPIFSLADVKQLFWSPDETMLAVRRYDHQIWIYNADGSIHSRLSDDATGAPVVPDWSPLPLETVVWSADSQRLAHVYGGTVAIWDINR